MAERRMRLKRGKIGDTGVVAQSVEPPALSLPESLSQEPSAFDEDMVDRIAEAVGCAFLDDDAESVVRHAIKLTMATVNMQHVLNPPPAPIAPVHAIGAPIRFASVGRIDVTVNNSYEADYPIDGSAAVRILVGTEVEVNVKGAGDPVTMLRQAADRFHDTALTTVHVKNSLN